MMSTGYMIQPVPAAQPLPPVDPPGPKTKADKELEKALRHKLVALASVPITSRSLQALEQTARMARELLAAQRMPQAFQGPGSPMPFGGYTNSIGVGQLATPGWASPASSPETFGANAIRELVAKSGDGDKKIAEEDPVKIVEAIALARSKGLNKLADKLEARLGVEEPVVIVEPKQKMNGARP